MIYGYIRVNTDKQTVENRRYEIHQFCEKQTIVVSKWIEETISGSKSVDDRKLGKLLKKMRKEDTSRFGNKSIIVGTMSNIVIRLQI